MNFVDIIIIGLVIAAIGRGLRVGMVRITLSMIGLALGVFIGSKLASLAVTSIPDNGFRFYAALSLLVLVGAGLAGVGDVLGHRLSGYAARHKLQFIDSIAGSVVEVAVTLVIAWLLGSVLATVQTSGVSQNVRGSGIISLLNTVMPTPPDILHDLGQVLRASGAPNVFVGNEPPLAPVSKNVKVETAAMIAARASVVKISSLGCGGVVEGSGFVTRPGVVLTNAHVVAGITGPVVYNGNQHYGAKTVYFDPELDLAILNVPGLPVVALPFDSAITADNTPIAAMGYPNDGPLTISGGTVVDHVNARGRDIYDKGIVKREIYRIAADIQPGNSGGPLINADGKVAGIVFAKSFTDDSVGYVLLANQLTAPIDQYASSHTEVSTASCVKK